MARVLPWLALLACACSFEPPVAAPQANGQSCRLDSFCQTGICEGGICRECRANQGCAAGQTCDLNLGQCRVEPNSDRRHASDEGQHYRSNGQRAHVGRVAIVPVQTEVQR
jgi:hypothetical protein